MNTKNVQLGLNQMKNTKKPKMAKNEINRKTEAQRVQERIQGFVPENSPAYQAIKAKFPFGISRPDLKEVARIISLHTQINLDRDAQRDYRVLVKWFDENWIVIAPFLERITPLDVNMNIIEK